jgi:hypothetical protein
MARLISRLDGLITAQELAEQAAACGVEGVLMTVRILAGGRLEVSDRCRRLIEPPDSPLDFVLECRIDAPLSPREERHAALELVPWLAHVRCLKLETRPLLVLADLHQLSHPWFSPRRLRQTFRRAGLVYTPMLLGLQQDPTPPGGYDSYEGMDGIVEDAWRAIRCGIWYDKADYESFLFHAQHRPATDRMLIPAVLPLLPDQERSFCHGTAKTYREWLEASCAWCDIWHQGGPGSWVLLESFRGHQRWARPDGVRDYPRPDSCSISIRDPQRMERGWGEMDSEHSALLVHGFYPDMLEEMFGCMAPGERASMDLYLTTPLENMNRVEEVLRSLGWVRVRMFGVENRGRDMAPFLHELLPAALAQGHQWFFKLHTKRSQHLAGGRSWAEHLINSLLRPGRPAALIQRLKGNPRLALLAPAGSVLSVGVCLVHNSTHLLSLLEKTGIQGRWFLGQSFVAGSMFAGRLEALRPLLEITPPLACFELEEGQTDGTLAHAFERLLGAVVADGGFALEELPGPPEQSSRFGHEWARPSASALPALR